MIQLHEKKKSSQRDGIPHLKKQDPSCEKNIPPSRNAVIFTLHVTKNIFLMKKNL